MPYTEIINGDVSPFSRQDLTYFRFSNLLHLPEIDIAVQNWARVSGLDITEVDDPDLDPLAVFLFTTSPGWSYADEAPRYNNAGGTGEIRFGYVRVDTDDISVRALMSEMGHVLGLQKATTGTPGQTVMADYTGQPDTGALPWDIDALQSLYGPNGRFEAEAAGSALTGGEGFDWMVGAAGGDDLNGARGADKLWGNEGHDILRGGKGHDTLDGGAGDDTLYGGLGDDVITLSAGDDVVMDFGRGADRIEGDIASIESTDDGLMLTGTDGGTVLLMGVFTWPGADIA